MSQRGTLLFGLVLMAALALALCPAGYGGGGGSSSSASANTASGAGASVGTITLKDKGSIAGTVLPSGAWTTAVVSVLPAGGGAAAASGAVNAADGTFSLPVPPGSGYALQVTATGFVGYDTALLSPPVTFTMVALTATSAGTITLTAGP
jgi:hypothetical protein